MVLRRQSVGLRAWGHLPRPPQPKARSAKPVVQHLPPRGDNGGGKFLCGAARQLPGRLARQRRRSALSQRALRLRHQDQHLRLFGAGLRQGGQNLLCCCGLIGGQKLLGKDQALFGA